MNYLEFLRTKIEIAPKTGFVIKDDEINPALKPHQRDAVKWAVAGGRRGPDCGDRIDKCPKWRDWFCRSWRRMQRLFGRIE